MQRLNEPAHDEHDGLLKLNESTHDEHDGLIKLNKSAHSGFMMGGGCVYELLCDQVSQLVPEFNQMSKTKKFEVLLFGFPNNDQFDLNIKIAKIVQTYILQAKRFLMRN